MLLTKIKTIGFVTLAVILVTSYCIAGSLLLSGFETKEDIARWSVKVKSGSLLEQVSENVTEGQYAAKFTTPKYQSGLDEYPALILNLKDFQEDWYDYDQLSFDFFSPNLNENEVYFGIKITDSGGTSLTSHIYLKNNSRGAITVDFKDLTVEMSDINGERTVIPITFKKLNLMEVVDLRLFLITPPESVIIYLDNMRLIDSSEIKLEDFAVCLANMCENDAALLKSDPILFESWKMLGDIMKSDLPLRNKAEIVEAQLELLESNLSAARVLMGSKNLYPGIPFGIAWADSMVRVYPKDKEPAVEIVEKYDLKLAKNEYESCQLVVVAPFSNELKNVSVKPDKFISKGGQPFQGEINIAPVGFVKTRERLYYPYFCWFTDPILSFLENVNVSPGEMQSFWVTVKTQNTTPPGKYMGNFIIECNYGGEMVRSLVPFEFEVWNFEIPRERHLPTAMGVGACSIGPEDMQEQIFDLLVDYRINADHIYRSLKPGSSECDFPPIEKLIEWKEKGMNKINLIYLHHNHKPKTIEWLDVIVPILKENDLYDIAYLYGFDEMGADLFPNMMNVVYEVKKRYPDLSILTTTALDSTYGEAKELHGLIDAWCPVTVRYLPEQAEKVRKQGTEVWWYVATAPNHAPFGTNLRFEFPAIDPRLLMGFHASYFKPDGFLYYSLQRWLDNEPITSGPYTTWDPVSFTSNLGDYNGGGNILYAGSDRPLSSIRLENMRDGLEDYEYYWIVEECLRQAQKKELPQDLINKAQAALEFDESFISSISDFTRDPKDVRRKREELANVIEMFIEKGLIY